MSEKLKRINLVSAVVGSDQVPYTAIVNLHDEALPSLMLQLFTALFAHNKFPPEWKSTNCVDLPKAGKSGYGSVKADSVVSPTHARAAPATTAALVPPGLDLIEK